MAGRSISDAAPTRNRHRETTHIADRKRLSIAAILIVATLLLGLAAATGATLGADAQLSRMFALRAGESGDATIAFVQGVSWLGGGAPRWIVALLLASILWRWAGPRPALCFIAAAIAANLASGGLKLLFERPRPDLAPHLDHVSSFSYPSGHATSVTAIALGFALLAPPGWRRWTWPVAIAAILLTLLSRVMLGVHWPSDVLGGAMLGTAFALLGVWRARISARLPG